MRTYEPAPIRPPGLRPWMLLVVLAAGYCAMAFGIPVYFRIVQILGDTL